MEIRLNNFKKMVENKRVSLLGKVRTNLLAAQVSLLTPEFRENARKKAEANIRNLLAAIREYESELEKLQKERIVASNQKGYTKMLDDHYESLIRETRNKLNDANFRLSKYQRQIARFDAEDAAFYEIKVSKAIKKQEHSVDNSIKEEQKKKNLHSYFVKDRFEFGDKVIAVNKNMPSKTYEEIMREFEKAENSKYMNQARKIEALGRALVGSDFIRKFYSLNDQNRRTVLVDLAGKLKDIPVPQGFADKSIDEQVNILKSLSLPSYRNNMLNILENQKTNKFIAENIQDIDLSDIEEPVIKEAVQENIATEITPIEKDAHTLAIEEAQMKQKEIKQKMSDVRQKFERKVQEAAAFYPNDPDVIYSIREANAAPLHAELADLDTQLTTAKKEEQDAFLARRQEKIDADKKAREERLKELNRKAKEEFEAKQQANEILEAKDILSHLETSTGFYDITNMTDEDILETYNSIKNSPSMEARIEKAKETAQNDKNKEIELSVAPESKEDVSEVAKEEISEVVEEPISNEPVESKVELKGLNEDELEQLSNKSKEQNKVLEDDVQEVMEKFGVSEVQARAALENPIVMQVLEQTYGNPSEEKTESKSR